MDTSGRVGFGPRTFNLPHNIDTDKIQASLEGGVLVIVMPKLRTKKDHPNIRVTDVSDAAEVPGMGTDIGRSSE